MRNSAARDTRSISARRVCLPDEECGILLKDDVELKNYLHDNMIVTINKLLKAESTKE